MSKSITFSVLAILLATSILAPSIEALCFSDVDNAVTMDLNEEENNKQEPEKELDEKELFFSSYPINTDFSILKKEPKSKTYLISFINYSAEIVLPPPKYLA